MLAEGVFPFYMSWFHFPVVVPLKSVFGDSLTGGGGNIIAVRHTNSMQGMIIKLACVLCLVCFMYSRSDPVWKKD